MTRLRQRPRLSSRTFRRLTAASCLALAVALTGCSGSDDGGGQTPPTAPGNPIQVSGYVLKGAVNGASVHVRAIDAAGNLGATIGGPFTTDASGRWSGEVPKGTSGVYAVTANGGTYVDEANGATVNVRSEMLGVIMVGTTNSGNVTPITHAIVLNAQYRVQLGDTKSGAFAGAIGDMTAAIGFDPTTVVPIVPSISSAASAANMDIYYAILAGFSELIDSNPALSPAFDNAETWDIVKAVAEDLTDGKLDAVDIAGNGIFVDPDGNGQGTHLPFPPLDADDISNLIDAARAWAAVSLPGVTIPSINLSAFGSPTVTPGGEWLASGVLNISGPDQNLLAPFAPDEVWAHVEEPGISGFSFVVLGEENIDRIITITFDPTDPTKVANVSGQVLTLYSWITTEFPPIPGLTVTVDNLGAFVFSFVDVTMGHGIGAPVRMTLNGTLTASPR